MLAVLLVVSVASTYHAAEHDCQTQLDTLHLTADQLPTTVTASAAQAVQSLSKPPSPLWESWAGKILSADAELISVSLRLAGGRLRLLHRTNSTKIRTSEKISETYHRILHRYNNSSPTWTHPFWDCAVEQWIFGYISPITDNRGQVGVYYLLEKAELDLCNEHLSCLIPNSLRCDPQSTKCETESSGLNYRCSCLSGFVALSHSNYSTRDEPQIFGEWGPGDTGVYSCISESSCLAEPHFILRAVVICVQILSMVFTIGTGIIIFKRRKCKPVAVGMWTILETLLLGILLLYGSMVPLSFEPSVETCILLRWIRELGFIICYGAIILKLYRILMEFRTRKAHRWVVRDKDLLKYLFGMVMVMFAYLAAWTATNINFVEEGFSIVALGITDSGEYFQTCKPLWWDYVTQAGEIVILLFGLHLGLAARNATVQYVELRYLLGAIVIETLVSSLYYVAHATLWNTLHPSLAYIVAFMRCHFTSSIVLLLIFAPIILYNQKPVRDSRHHLTHEPSDAYKPQDGIYGEIDVAEVNLSEMNPEEIRAELKRLYTQLEVLRNKTICQNNPHISKRRGGRKVAHRRFSLQKKGSREKALQQKQKSAAKQNSEGLEPTEQEVSRTPEDSVCSNEGPSAIYNDGPSTYSELGGFGTPTVQHRNSKQ
ncbi:G-protein coupled receptor 158 smog isoform X2 [Rhodnius prolixus]|uniref:G-protein coupled receptor 158 smog isoform X2 n=1 Tax=Rhodnius prolixus TaxID=13249 RepID=UPI003D18DCB4